MEQRRSKSQVRGIQSKVIVNKASVSRLTRNPFLNFLRDYRKSNTTNLKITELARRGAQLWRGMSDREKSPYISISKQAPKYKQSRRRSRRRRKRKGRKRRRRSRSRSWSSSVTTDSNHKKADRDKKQSKDEKGKDRGSSSGKKSDKKSNGSNERNSVNNKKAHDEYEVKYKNSRYEESRDFI